MPIKCTPSAEDAVPQGYVVVAPRTSDVISGALRTAFERQDARPDDFSLLLRQIDIADRDARRR
jgi:hypothetical protein